jgi:hypothetical protein
MAGLTGTGRAGTGRAGTGRARTGRLRPVALAALALALVLPAGCRSQPADRVATPSLVPWTDAGPPELVERPVPAAPRCRPAQLRVAGAGFAFQPAEGGSGGTGTARLRNAGPGPCRLDGRPTVRFVGAAKSPSQRQVPLPPGPPSFPKVLPPAATLHALAPGAAATLTIDWRNWCVPGAARGGPLAPPKAARVTLPGGTGSLDLDYSAVTSCADPTQPATVGVRPFQPAALANPAGWTNVRVQAAVRTRSGGEPPLHGRRGELVSFAVELRNPNRETTVHFDHCPVLAELLVPAGTAELHQLNCAAATPIPPGGALLFEMRLLVPAAAPAGPNGLFWALDATSSQPLTVVSRLIVDD